MYRDDEAAADDIVWSADDIVVSSDDHSIGNVGVGAVQWMEATLALPLPLRSAKNASNKSPGSVDPS